MEKHEIIAVMHPHAFAYFGNYIAGIVLIALYPWLSIVGPAIGAFVIAVTELVRRSESYSITRKGVMREFIFLSRSSTFVEYGQIANIGVQQNVFERLLHIGTIAIDTAGADHVELHFRHVYHPHHLQELIRSKGAEKI